ncbi:putative reverse transcriptase domain-containing protein [Tanacetum coccineum]
MGPWIRGIIRWGVSSNRCQRLLGRRVGVRTYLLGGAIDGSKTNGSIHDPKLELESSRFTFDLVPLSYESVDVVVGENWLLRHKAEMVCHEKVVKMPWSCNVRVGSNGNLLWEVSVLLGRKKGCIMDMLKFTVMPFGLTNAPVVFMELMSRSKEEYESHVKMIVESLKEEKMYVRFSQQLERAKKEAPRCEESNGNDPILGMPNEWMISYNNIDARSKDLEHAGKRESELLYVAKTEGNYSMAEYEEGYSYMRYGNDVNLGEVPNGQTKSPHSLAMLRTRMDDRFTSFVGRKLEESELNWIELLWVVEGLT